MNPINDEISEKDTQNPTILEDKEKVETSAGVESNNIISSELETTDKTKETDTVEETQSVDTKNEATNEESQDLSSKTENKQVENEADKELSKSVERTEEADAEDIVLKVSVSEDCDENSDVKELNKQPIEKSNETDPKEDCGDTDESSENNTSENEDDKELNKQPIEKSNETDAEDNVSKASVSEDCGDTDENSENNQSDTSKTVNTDDDKQNDNKNLVKPKENRLNDTKSENKLKEKTEQEPKKTDEKAINKTKFLSEDNDKEIGNKIESKKAPDNEVEFEDVEIPEEVEELIVPDEEDAEDLTSLNGDCPDTSLNEDESTKFESEAEEDVDKNVASINEDDTTKGSEAVDDQEDENTAGKDNTFSNDDEEDLTKDTEEEVIEPELVAIEENSKERPSLMEDNSRNTDEEATNHTINDPLNCTDNQEQEDERENKSPDNENDGENVNNIDDDDDDDDDDEDEVQFVETRNSPICIESDDDDDASTTHNTSITTNPKTNIQTINTPTASITVPKNIIVTRTSARKSTAKAQNVATPSHSKTVPQIQNKTKNFTYLEKATNYRSSPAPSSKQQVVDCIELLDSSDEETRTLRRRPLAQQSRTPQKRTLLSARGSYNKNSNKNFNTSGHFPPSHLQIRKQAKKPAPPPLPPATPQSNFLNAVQLQPAAVSGVNPPAFSALLSNKSVIIPNAFYGNHPNVRGSGDAEMELRYARWLDGFLTQFCSPQHVATHSCFVLLQRSLKYKDFARIKAIRTNLNTQAQNAKEQSHTSLMVDLRTILLKNNRELTTHGRRFCELACNSSSHGKAVTLIAHGSTGRVTLRTCNMEIPKASTSSSSSSSTAATTSLTYKRRLERDEAEYMPDKQKLKTIINRPPSENGDSGETSEDRKRSLRTKRTKRLDNSFSYNEDDLLAEYEIEDEDEDEKVAEDAVRRKIEQKRLEAQKQREQQVKSFESAFIQAFAKRPEEDGPDSSTPKSDQRLRLRNSSRITATSVRQHMANNDTENLLEPTWIENDDTQIISDDDEPKVHRIYKKKQEQYQQQLQEQYQPAPKLPTKYNVKTTPTSKFVRSTRRQQQEEIITGDDDYIENEQFFNNPPPSDVDPSNWPKNVDRQMHVSGKFKDRCVVCNLNCQRIVHHYVNEHRGCEVYNSRLTSSQIHLLRQGNSSDSNMSMYKNGQPQYEAYCIFCQKQSRFMLPYWYQHFTMHTGEYAYRCTGCGIRKPTRSLLTQHQGQTGCSKKGSIIQDYSHDPKSVQVEARVCTLCNYVQLHRSNIVKHLHQQHNIRQILPKHIQTIVLLKTPSSTSTSASPSPSPSSLSVAKTTMQRRRHPTINYQIPSSSSSSSSPQNTFIIDDDENNFIVEHVEPSGQQTSEDTQNQYYNYIPPYMQAGNAAAANFTWEENDPAEDLSFMICGMLDVQMNTE